MVTAIYAGFFDPITLGHIDIINRSVSLFDNICVAIGVNSNKNELFLDFQREKLILDSLNELLTADKIKKIQIKSFKGLLIDFAKAINATIIIRGMRSVSDFEYEINLANINKTLDPNIETIFIPTNPMLSMVSSSAVKEIAKNKGNILKFVSRTVALKTYKEYHDHFTAIELYDKYLYNS